ncbi:prolipoprotein diacylglyceryl transferase [Bartonella sp. DGB1]|uniref:prolipoprotein diacylglyceryl transferase n=1 Tax=Bartonella sp. DGB1 TaxID=3239807 RepID=UPI0035244035
MGLEFPNISPIAFSIGFFNIHWYGLGYLVGILFAWLFSKYLLKQKKLWRNAISPLKAPLLDDLIVYATLGIIIGGRLGYILFYNFNYYLSFPSHMFFIWDGGMSFHGGFLGCLLAFYLFSKKYKINLIALFDLVAVSAPVGIGLVRICNFINSELWGKVTNVPWGVKFPNGGINMYGDLLSRHPSQLYEALLEGLFLFLLLLTMVFLFHSLKRTGLTSGIFAVGYSISRIFVEFFREPDAQLGYLYNHWLTMGMILSFPMLFAGIYLIIRSYNVQKR